MSPNVAASGCASYTDAPSYVATIVAREDARVEAVVLLASLCTGAKVDGGFDSHSTARAVDANRKNTTAPARSRPLRVTWRRCRMNLSSPPPRFLLVAPSPCSDAALRRRPLHRTELPPFPPYGGDGLKSVRKRKTHTLTMGVCVAQTLAYAMSARQNSTQAGIG